MTTHPRLCLFHPLYVFAPSLYPSAYAAPRHALEHSLSLHQTEHGPTTVFVLNPGPDSQLPSLMTRGISVAVAIVVGLVSSFVQSIGELHACLSSTVLIDAGLTIQRKSHVQEDVLPLQSRRKPIRRPLWLLGFAIYITSNVFSTIFQLDALPIVILAPLGAVSLIFNALLARIVLGDSFGPSSIVGTALVTVGAVMIAVFGVVQEEEHGLDEILRLWKRGPFLAFFSILCAVVLTILSVVSDSLAPRSRLLTTLGSYGCLAYSASDQARDHTASR